MHARFLSIDTSGEVQAKHLAPVSTAASWPVREIIDTGLKFIVALMITFAVTLVVVHAQAYLCPPEIFATHYADV
jgi:hypothetical protein